MNKADQSLLLKNNIIQCLPVKLEVEITWYQLILLSELFSFALREAAAEMFSQSKLIP